MGRNCGICQNWEGSISQSVAIASVKDVRGWQFLTVEAPETLCMVCLPPEEHIFRKKYLSNQPAFQKVRFCKGLTIKFVFLRIF